MKRLSFLLALFCLLAFSSKAVTVSGTISYASAAGPASSVKVYLYDTNQVTHVVAAIDSAITSSTGSYSFIFTTTINHLYWLRCNVCSSPTYYSLGFATGTSITANITLGCAGISVRDTVRNITNGAFVYGQKVYISNATATYKDSAYTNYSGTVTFTVPPGTASGTFTVSTFACGLQSQTFSYPSVTIAPTLYVCLNNAVISGTVTNASTSAPVPFWNVKVTDSSGTAMLFVDSVITNSTGFYSIVVPVSVNTGAMIAATQACGSRIRNSATFSGASLTLNLSVCATSTATISGVITNALTSAAVAGQKVYLYDSTGSFPPVIYRDSTVTNASGGYSFSIPPTKMTGQFQITTPSCGAMAFGMVYYSGSSHVLNLSVYVGTPKILSGTFYTRNGAPAASSFIQLNILGVGSFYTSTNTSGAYSFNIPCTTTSSTLSLTQFGGLCSSTRSIAYSGSSIIGLVDTVCYLSASGIVSKQGGGAAANAKVYLIRQSYDTTSTPALVTLTAIDSTLTNAAGQYQFFPIAGLSGAMYNFIHVKAALQSSDPAYASFLPTYYDSSLIWSAADTVSLTQLIAHANNINISLRGGVNPGGLGFIGGNVLLGANKNVGDPIDGRLLLLTTTSGKGVAYTYSNAAGKFSFTNLPIGSYKIFGDAWGKTNPALAVTLSNGSSTVNNIVFEENDVSFKGHFNGLSVGNSSALQAISIYPNPVKNYVAFNGLSSIKGDKAVVLRNVAGATVVTATIAAGASSEIPTTGLPAGIYLLQLQTIDGVGNFRFMKE